jgi:hypothetical protein
MLNLDEPTFVVYGTFPFLCGFRKPHLTGETDGVSKKVIKECSGRKTELRKDNHKTFINCIMSSIIYARIGSTKIVLPLLPPQFSPFVA